MLVWKSRWFVAKTNPGGLIIIAVKEELSAHTDQVPFTMASEEMRSSRTPLIDKTKRANK